MSRENTITILRGRLAVTQALWDYEREEILKALGVVEIDPRAWSTEVLVEEIKDCIDGATMLASVLYKDSPPASESPNRAVSGEFTLDNVEDWLNDIPLF